MSGSENDNPRLFMPRLAYQDAEAAAQFLCTAFGFTETGRFAANGKIVHAEFSMNGKTVFALGAASDSPDATQSPLQTGCSTVQLFCYVDDVDVHFLHARQHGARVVSEPCDQIWGDRTWEAVDPEGYKWTFRKHVRDVSLEELHSAVGGENETGRDQATGGCSDRERHGRRPL